MTTKLCVIFHGRFVRSSSGSRKKRVTILVLGIYSASTQCPALPSPGGPWSHLQRRGVLHLLMRRIDYLLIVFIAFSLLSVCGC